MGRGEKTIGIGLATAVLLTGTACNGPERLKNNPDNGLYGTPHVGATATQSAIDPPNGCPPLEEYEILGPSDLGGAYTLPKVPDNSGEKEGPDPNSYPPGTPMLAKNLGRCVLIQGGWLDNSPGDILERELFVIGCIYYNPAEGLPPKLVAGTVHNDGSIAQAGYIKVSDEIANDITNHKPRWLAYCGFPAANIPDVFTPKYPDQNARPQSTTVIPGA